MSDIQLTYPVFESNQVLTSTQLNKLVVYLDQQNRLTRAKLIGMGIVCGLEVSYDKSEDQITISKGTGITSEGYLISLGDCDLVNYRPYTLPAGTIYEPFVDDNNEQDITLYELLTDAATAGPNDEPLNDEAFLADKVVLLFIEAFDKDLKSCLGKGCDELGKERILTPRKLLISKTDLATVWSRTNTGKLDASFPEKFDLPVVNLTRDLFDPTKSHSLNYTDFSKNYADQLLTVFDDLVDALSETYKVYRPLLLDSYDENNPFEENPVTNKLAALQNFLNDSDGTYTSYLGIQYVYDLFQDLVLAYNEFKEASFDLMSECCADTTRFPKHLMLGEAIAPALSPCEESQYRHHFVQPPVYNLQKQLVQRTISLHNRMVLMLQSFDLERVNGIAEGIFPIRITPSLEKTTPLSMRSIPWYYDANATSSYSSLGMLKKYWSYDVYRRCPKPADGLILNYDDQSNNQSVAKNKLETPMFYDIDDYSFLRIEGYIDKSVDDAISAIDILKKRFNLPFDIVKLKLNPAIESLEIDYSCGFEDLQEEYASTRGSLCGIISDMAVLYDFVSNNQDELFDDDGSQEEILNQVKELLDLLSTLCENLSDCIQDFDLEEFQQSYKAALQYIIDFILIDMNLLEEIEIKDGEEEKLVPLFNGLLQRMFPLAFKIVDLFFYTKFLRIYYAFKRREFYLRKDTGVFSRFIKNHPGISHLAGVPKGGTFVLVYEDSEDNNAIADFSLPYLCCGSQNCVPTCEEGDFTMEIIPFARPDYAITTVGQSVEIDVMINDYNMYGGDVVIDADKLSEFDGNITQLSPKGPLRYSPKIDFVGVDTFSYKLINRDTGNQDEAVVTIVIKERDVEEEGCYSIAILQCWGEELVRETLALRGIEYGQREDVFLLLLGELRRTGGFTEDEVFYNVLEGGDRRRRLLQCIGIPFDDNTSYDQLGELIFQYQRDNCGGTPPVTGCYSAAVLECWGQESTLATLEYRGVRPSPIVGIYQQLSTELRRTGGFTEDELYYNVLEGYEVRQRLLKCIGIPFDEDTGYEQLGELILQYQNENCGGAPPVTGCYSTSILECWGEKAVVETLQLREVEPDPAIGIYQQLLDELRRTGGFTESELNFSILESGEMRLRLLECIGIPIDERITYAEMGELILEYQRKNCGTTPPATGCYSTSILECWGEKFVLATLQLRGLQPDPTMSVFQQLLDDLRRTGGFTDEEIFGSILEEEEMRRQLLNCIGIPINDGTTYAQLGILIQDYQKQNCSTAPPVTGCYSTAVLQCWGEKAVAETLRLREIPIDPDVSIYQQLLNDLERTGGFTESELFGSILENESSRRQLLTCVGIPINIDTSYEQLGELIMEYQRQNCGAAPPVTGCYSTGILQCWGDQMVVATLELRGIKPDPSLSIYQQLLNDLRRTGGFTESEIFSSVLEGTNSRRQLLSCIGIPFDGSTSYEQLGDLIFQYQKENCGGETPTSGCYSRETLECWGEKNVMVAFEFIGMDPGADPFTDLLGYLQLNGGFSEAQIGFLIESNTLYDLLNCLMPGLPREMSGDEMRKLLLDYQQANCQGRGAIAGGVAIDTGLLSANDLSKVLVTRGIDVGASAEKATVEKALTDSKEGAVLSEEEMMALPRATLVTILDSKDVSYTTRDNKTELVKKLIDPTAK